MSETENNFLSRWSQRKQAIAAGEEISELSPEEAAVEDERAQKEFEESDERQAELEANKEAAEAIDLETLNYDSDFSAFFKEGVPMLLRQKALRILWRSNPILANIDGLCDYDENFADPSLILKKFESAYKIGKGYIIDEDEEDIPDVDVAQAEEVSEDEEVENADSEEAVDGEAEEEVVSEEDTEPSDEITEKPAVTARADDDAVQTAEAEELLAYQEEPQRPRVSLRKRLQFDV